MSCSCVNQCLNAYAVIGKQITHTEVHAESAHGISIPGFTKYTSLREESRNVFILFVSRRRSDAWAYCR